MSTVAILIALFVAANDPTPINCQKAVDALATQAADDALRKGTPVHWDEDIQLVKQFKTTCRKAKKK